MEKTFIIIGAKAISNSLSQVLGLFSSYNFLHFDLSGFTGISSLISELEQYKNNTEIKGFIVTEPDGIEIAKHLRLTVQLQNLRILPLIVITPESITHLLTNKRDNIFLLSKKMLPVAGIELYTRVIKYFR